MMSYEHVRINEPLEGGVEAFGATVGCARPLLDITVSDLFLRQLAFVADRRGRKIHGTDCGVISRVSHRSKVAPSLPVRYGMRKFNEANASLSSPGFEEDHRGA